MLTAALLELFDDCDEKIKKLNSFSIPGAVYEMSLTEKCGIKGTKVSVKIYGEEENGEEHHHHHRHHTSFSDVENIIGNLTGLSDKVKSDALNVYRIIADAESKVHGVPVTDIHFHEVGTADAIADVVAVCYLIGELSPGKITASPVNTGSGTVKCAHGILPVPAPATAEILKGMTAYSGNIQSELCTPTGAALLKYFVSEFSPMPVMKITKIGYGMGSKDFETANCVRAIMGESEDETQKVAELSCSIDDMTAEDLSFAVGKLFEAGANDVYTYPVNMKKGRTGIMLSVVCSLDLKEKLIQTIFRYTSTIGMREAVYNRRVLDRIIRKEETPYGAVGKKISSGYGTVKEKYEYDDIAGIADELNLTLEEVRNKLDTE